MIVGELGTLGRPYVHCRLSLQRLGIAVDDVTFLVDTGADSTYLHPRDSLEFSVPFDLLRGGSTSRGIGGTASYFPEPAVLVFTDEATGQDYGYRININVAKPDDVSDRIPSLLGRDVIRRWQMDYDPTYSKLEFTVRDADFIIDLQ